MKQLQKLALCALIFCSVISCGAEYGGEQGRIKSEAWDGKLRIRIVTIDDNCFIAYGGNLYPYDECKTIK